MFRRTQAPVSVQWAPQRFTKDGRPRARRPLWGVHRTSYKEKLPWPIVAGFAFITVSGIWSMYKEFSKASPQKRFLQKIAIVPHGVLGTQLHAGGTLLYVANEPDFDTAVVDPAGLHHIHGVAEGAGGAAGAIYKWLGITGKFPDEVKLSINVIGDAKSHKYRLADTEKVLSKLSDEAKQHAEQFAEEGKIKSVGAGSAVGPTDAHLDALAKKEKETLEELLCTRTIIHALGPDFRAGKWTDREASLALSRAYRNLLHEFVVSDCHTLRVAPVSAGIFSGPLYNQIPVLTQEALAQGFDQLHQYDKEALLDPKKRIELCVFMQREWDAYCNSFDYVAPPQKL